MTRPKVAPEARQRTAQACESCKRRKQKCDGLTPCVTCSKRKFECIYVERAEPGSPSAAAPHSSKRRMVESNFETPELAPNGQSSTHGRHSPQHQNLSSTFPPQQPQWSFSDRQTLSHQNSFQEELQTELQAERQSSFPWDRQQTTNESLDAARSLQQFSATRTEDLPTKSSQPQSQVGNIDDEAVVYSQTRMLQDPTGRLLYIGDSATLSFLSLIRMMVESVAGPSPFTTDPRRHTIIEGQFSLPANSRVTQLIPDKLTAFVLAESFFTNTQGMVQIFDRHSFMQALETAYLDPLSVEPNWLCLLNMVWAIGLMLAVAVPGTEEAVIVERLQTEHLDRAELFYLNAKSLNDPITGLEDADFWSVQALLLMTVYMLAKSKRNTAYALLGMAIRSSFALGLHREETLMLFSTEEQIARRRVWKSLFVMDRFLSCSLGRPPGISEDDCSGDTLKSQELPPETDEMGFNLPTQDASLAHTSEQALDAAVRSCSAIGIILKRVYRERKISTTLAQEIADICKEWPKALPPVLHWRQATSATTGQGIAILHANLLYCHSIALLTRPFFLFILNNVLQQTQTQGLDLGSPLRRHYAKLEKFSEACVIASTHTVILVQNAFEASHLSRRNPFVVYFLFAAAIIVLSNEYALLYRCHAAHQCIRNSISIMAYCAESDPQAERMLSILTAYKDVVMKERQKRALKAQEAVQLPPFHLKPNGVNSNSQPISPNGSASMHGNPAHINLPPVSSAAINSFTNFQQGRDAQNQHQHDRFQHRYSGSPTDQATNSSNFSPHSLPTNSSTRPMEPTPPSPAPPNPLARRPPTGESAANVPHASQQPGPPQMFYPPINPAIIKDTVVNATNALQRERELANVNTFQFSTMNGNDRIFSSGDSSGPEEHIDFDALWNWPANTPALGTPRAGTCGNA